MDGSARPERRWVVRFAKGATPVAIVLGLLYVLSRNRSADGAGDWLAELVITALCCFTLWAGWRWLQGTFVTKWAGRLLATYLGLGLVLFTLGIVLAFSMTLFLPFLLALPFILYDLFVWQPHKGRFARARAERRGTLQ
jgi:hypothetical protein